MSFFRCFWSRSCQAHTRLFSLLDIVHADSKLYLVFEFLDVDLKRYVLLFVFGILVTSLRARYMETINSKNGNRGLDKQLIKVWTVMSFVRHQTWPNLSEIHISITCWLALLPWPPNTPPRLEATKLVDWWVKKPCFVFVLMNKLQKMRISSWQILVLLVRLGFRFGHIPTRLAAGLEWIDTSKLMGLIFRLSRYGTVRQRFCLAHATIAQPLTCGLSGVSLRRWSCMASHSFPETRRLTRSSGFLGTIRLLVLDQLW